MRLPTLVALLVCLIPTTIGALLAAIGIAGMDRALRADIIAKSGKAVELAGDVDTLLLDKTGTITIGNRKATQFVPLGGTAPREVARLAGLASMADQTPEGKSILELARQQAAIDGERAVRVAVHRVHGADADERCRPPRRDARSARGRRRPSLASSRTRAGSFPTAFRRPSTRSPRRARRRWPSPRTTASSAWSNSKTSSSRASPSGFCGCGKWACATVMVTGDNPLTAKAIADQAGVDDYIAQATPEAKLAYIRKEQARRQAGGHDGRRHQRRPGPGPGRRRRRHELRHPGRQGGRQHGGPRQRPHQAHRGRRDRQATADDPRRLDDLLDRQRRGQVFRDRTRPVRRRRCRG